MPSLLLPSGRLFTPAKLLLVFIVGCFTCSAVIPPAYCQAPGTPANLPSPNAASLGTFGDIPVNLYTGAPDISVPLYQIEDGDITIPLTLRYHPASVKVNAHPGWVGLGWTLTGGGAITRTVRGVPDEMKQTNGGEIGYYWQHSRLDDPNWNSQTSLNDFAEKWADYLIYRASGLDYNAFMYEVMADEFAFNFMGYSGKFYRNPKGEWQVVSQDDITVEFDEQTGFLQGNDVGTNFPFYNDYFFHQFTLTTPDGTRYIFGGTQPSVEYSAPHRNQSNGLFVATTWYLTKIESPQGREATFEYGTTHFTVSLAQSYGLTIYSSPSDNGFFSRDRDFLRGGCSGFSSLYGVNTNKPLDGFIMTPSYLEKITFRSGSVTFNRSESNELRYLDTEWVPGFDLPFESFYIYFESRNDLKWHKLDRMVVEDYGGSTVRTFDFQYQETPSERLKLRQVRERGAGQGTRVHQFDYNPIPLPSYGEDQVDHWGYYNAAVGEYTFLDPDGNTYINFDQYINQRRFPDNTGQAQLAELLQRITYPTRGYTEFEFEAHRYGKSVKPDREAPVEVLVTTEDQSIVAGGTRIRKIKSVALDGSSVEKEFYYVKDYTAGQTLAQLEPSGVLASPFKYRWINFQANDVGGNPFTYSLYSSGSLLPYGQAASGSHIGYSEVVAFQGTAADNDGYTIYSYSNFDQDYRGDRYPDKMAETSTNADRQIYAPFTDISYQRGKLLRQKVHRQDGIILQQTENYYSLHTSFGYYDQIPMVDTEYLNICSGVTAGAQAWYAAAFYQPAQPYNLSQQNTYRYDESGGNPVVTQVDYTFNEHNLLESQTTQDSETRSRTAEYEYASDYTDATLGSDLLRGKRMLSQVLQQTDKVDNVITRKVETSYQSNGPIVVPAWSREYPEGGTTFIQMNYQYDILGNQVQAQRQDGVYSSYLWGYNQSVPIAEVQGISYDALTDLIDNTNGLSLANFNGWPNSESTLQDQLESLQEAIYIADEDALMTTRTYQPLVGAYSATSVNGLHSSYQYDALGRLKFTRDHQKRLRQGYYYHYRGQQP